MIVRGKALFKKNKVIIALSIMLIVAVLVIARYSRLPALPGFHWLDGPVPEDQIPYDLGIGYISCYVFYLIQVYIPQRDKERKAIKTLGSYLKEYVVFMKILEYILKENKLEELPDKDNELEYYKCTDQYGNVIHETFPIPITLDGMKQQKDGVNDNRFLSFLLKTQYIFETMLHSTSFTNLNEYLLEMLQKTDISFWVASYKNLLYMRQLGQKKVEIALENETSKKDRLDELGDALNKIEIMVGLKTVVEKVAFPDG